MAGTSLAMTTRAVIFRRHCHVKRRRFKPKTPRHSTNPSQASCQFRSIASRWSSRSRIALRKS
jgi:hypothetical protein